MKLRIKLAALVMAGSTAALVLAATPAMASSHAITGPEIAYGAVYGKAATANNPVIPVAWRGLVNAHGHFSPSGPAPAKGHAAYVQHVGREIDRNGYRRADLQPEFQPEDVPLLLHDKCGLRCGGQQEHPEFCREVGSGGRTGLLRRVRAEVQVRQAQRPVQNQPERARAVEGRRRYLPVQRRPQGVAIPPEVRAAGARLSRVPREPGPIHFCWCYGAKSRRGETPLRPGMPVQPRRARSILASIIGVAH